MLDGWFLNERWITDLDVSSADTEPEPTTTYPRTLMKEIEWESLSTSSLWTIKMIAIPMSEGYSAREIAKSLGTTTSWVLAQMDKLRSEIEKTFE